MESMMLMIMQIMFSSNIPQMTTDDTNAKTKMLKLNQTLQ